MCSFSEAAEAIVVEQVKDARVRRTQRRLRDALVSLIHEKHYPAIVVDEILERADVGRSAFYAHFNNKDALLASSIEHVLLASPRREHPAIPHRFAKALSFSFPVFEYIGRSDHSADAKMGRLSRAIVHEHLRRTLSATIADDVSTAVRSARRADIPPDLLTTHIVSTFTQVLNWWVENGRRLSPHAADDLFIALVAPTLTSIGRETEAALSR
jgi:AcrR family transcriptional regulator